MPDITFPQQLGMQAAGNAVGAGMGLLLQGINNRQQIKQQQKLTDMQIAAQKQMGIFNREQQMQLWNDTNYAAQKEQMKKAGLSPGLMYGTSGGGATTASATPGNVSAPQTKEPTASLGMGLQMGQAALMQAQIEAIKAQKANTDADTQNKLAENPNIPKAGVKLDTEVAALTQGIQNAKAQEELTKIQSSIAAVANEVAGKTQNMQIAKYQTELLQATKQLEIMNNQKLLTDTEVKWKEQQIKYTLANIAIDTYLKSEEAKGIQQGVKESLDRMKTNFQNRLMQGDTISNMNQGSDQDILNQSDVPEGVKMVLQAIGIGTIISGIKQPNKPTEIRGLHKRD